MKSSTGTFSESAFFSVYLLELLVPLVQLLRLDPLHQLGFWVALEAGDHLAVASAVEVSPLASRLARVVDRAAAREHEAERAGLGARGDSRERRALVPVAPHVGDDRLVEAAEGVVPRELAARPRERRVALLRELPRLVSRHVVHRPRLVDRHGDGLPEPRAAPLREVVVPLRRGHRRLFAVRLHEALHDGLRSLALLGDGRVLVGAAPPEDALLHGGGSAVSDPG